MTTSTYWQERRVLVTGGTGIVGSQLVADLLAAGAFVVALIRDQNPQSELYRSGNVQRIAVVNGGVEEYAALERAINKYEINTVFHLAAQAIVGVAQRNPLPTFEANIRGTYNLMEACRVHRDLVKAVVAASSDKAYGMQPELPYLESMPLEGRFPYEVSKSCGDLIAQSYFHTYQTPVSIARCGNIYGGGDLNWSRIVPGTIRSLLRGEAPVIRSDGTFLRDYVYVKDVTRAYMLLAEQTPNEGIKGEAFNFGPEKPLSVIEMVDLLRELMDAQEIAADIHNTAAGEIHTQYLDSSKAAEVLGWESQYTIDEGLKETIAWYQEFFKSDANTPTL
ncbi:MAG: GDP-mannose 4,6-dehydratase [Anaerolineae bacterium]|nr:GDP-mannose 4,6-dehydratase [Anaerolineae bacterium]